MTDYSKFSKAEDNQEVAAPVEEAPVTQTVPEIGEATCYVNVRSDKDVADNIIATLNEKEAVELDLSESDEYWYKVVTQYGIEGYVMADYIKVA
jgi:hypothetical protein